MRLSELDFIYPESLVATERAPKSRVMLVRNGDPCEVTLEQIIDYIEPGDLVVVNNTQVLKRRVFSQSGLEILFLTRKSPFDWEVLCPSSRWKAGEKQVLPGDVRLELTERGRPQTVRTSQVLEEDYFDQHGEMPLPPYIQKARGERHNRDTDAKMYQTAWAQTPGSLAAPTASLHFTKENLKQIQARGANTAELTLHVGLGTFLPIQAENLDQHEMHYEEIEISSNTWHQVLETRRQGGRVWAIGTTVARALESVGGQMIKKTANGFRGETNLFIKPGYEFKVVDVLMTNFHQPQSTLLALVGAFADLKHVKACYQWAIDKQFRLFSYGDLTVWIK